MGVDEGHHCEEQGISRQTQEVRAPDRVPELVGLGFGLRGGHDLVHRQLRIPGLYEAIDLLVMETRQLKRGQVGQAQVGLGPRIGRGLVGEDTAGDEEAIARIAVDEGADGIPHVPPLRTARHLVEAIEEQQNLASIERRLDRRGGEPEVLRLQPAGDEPPEVARLRAREHLG